MKIEVESDNIMANKEDELLLNNKKTTKNPMFDAPDGKILAFDMFRGPQMGFFSDIDLNNPAEKFEDGEDLRE